MIVNKDRYAEWEKQIIKQFYKTKKTKKTNETKTNTNETKKTKTNETKTKKTKTKKTKTKKTKTKTKKANETNQILPTNNNPLYAIKHKFVVVLDFIKTNNIALSKLVTGNKIADIPEKANISLYHTGNRKIDTVSLGLDKTDNIFRHPAFDLGGLTNYKQHLGKNHDLYDKQFEITQKTIITDKLLDEILSCWKKYYGITRFYGYDKKELKKVIKSVIKYLHENTDKYNGVYLKFNKIADEYRVIVTSHDIKAATGDYYIRIYGKGDDNYAEKIKPTASLYCAVTNSFITPNINKPNILNEYAV